MGEFVCSSKSRISFVRAENVITENLLKLYTTYRKLNFLYKSNYSKYPLV